MITLGTCTYGEQLSGSREGIRFLYNGRYGVVTDENGLYYMRARYYNVDIKRFINQDVLEGSMTDSPSLNRYAFCQGNPVKLTDPFGLSPNINWSTLGHAVLDALGFIPVVGAIADTLNGVWYMSEGDYFSAAASFVSAIPGWGDIVGAVGKGIKGCSKITKAIKYGSKIIGRIGNIALGSYQTGSIAVSLYDKHIVQGESWDWDSTVQLFSAGVFATTTAVSAKGLANDLSNYSSVKYDIQTSQCFVEGTPVLTKEGNKPIEEIRAGDLVYATNPETGESGYKEVLRTFRKESDVLIHVFVNGEEIETTAVHPFWVENRWVSAKDLKEGDLLTLADGSVARIAGVYGEKLDEAVVVYNFEVEEFHTYYVTDTGVLVHNANQVGGCGVTGNKSGSETRYYRTGYQSSGRSNNLFKRDRSTRRTTNLTEWRRGISRQDIHNEMRIFLGDDYVKIDSGKWRSLDGTRQFRVKPDDYLGNHGIGQPTVPNTPHVHFEFLTTRSNGNGFDVIKNIHVPISD